MTLLCIYNRYLMILYRIYNYTVYNYNYTVFISIMEVGWISNRHLNDFHYNNKILWNFGDKIAL